MTYRQLQRPVLHVTEAGLGGLRRHLADLMQGLESLGMNQALAYSPIRADAGMLRLVEWCKLRGIPVHSVPMRRNPAPRSDLSCLCEIRRLFRSLSPAIVHLHSSKAGGLGRLAALTAKGTRVVYTPNGLATHVSRWYRLIEWALGHCATDRLIAVSQSEFDEISTLGIVPRRRLVRVDSGISIEDIYALAEGTRVADFPNVVFVGRLSAQKDPLFAAEASALALKSTPDLRFIWVGDGELRQDFEARLRELRIYDSWTITGWVDNPFPIIAAATVCALCSAYESFGYVTLEAMALGKPVVATRVAGSLDLVDHGTTGFLIPPGNTAEFADAITRLVADHALRSKTGYAAAARATTFTRERMTLETVEVYEGLAAP